MGAIHTHWTKEPLDCKTDPNSLNDIHTVRHSVGGIESKKHMDQGRFEQPYSRRLRIQRMTEILSKGFTAKLLALQ